MESEKKALSDELLKETIDRVMAKVNSCENPDEIESIKKTIRKNVPFTRRGYFSAMLLKELLTASPRKERRERPVNNNNVAPKKEVKSEREEKKPLPEGAKTLYLNVGKMKHLYAKNLSQLLQSELGITRDDIYSLRVHDKYSFITMSEENCEKALKLLNGRDINGREAQLSYSTK